MDRTKAEYIHNQLSRRWYGRDREIRLFLHLLRTMQPIVVHGPSGTGKTSIVRDALKELQYCGSYLGGAELECSLPQLCHHIVNGWCRQLSMPEKKVSDAGEAWALLPSIAAQAQRKDTPLFMVVDGVDCSVDADWLTDILELQRRSPVAVGLIFISLVPWKEVVGKSNATVPMLYQHVHFTAYRQDQVLEILRRQRPEHVSEELYRNILHSYIKPSYAVSRLLTDAQALLADLLIEAQRSEASEIQAVLTHLHKARVRVTDGFHENYPGWSEDLGNPFPSLDMSGSAVSISCSTDKPIQLPRMTKILIVAAHIAANNKPAVDRRMFTDEKSTKRGRTDAGAADRQAMIVEEAATSLGQAFDSERWLQIFFQLVERDHKPHECCTADAEALPHDMQTSSVLNHMKQLTSIRLVSQMVARKDEIGGVTFKSLISEELARSVAESIGMKLNEFIEYV